ncbi:MAG: cyclic nucleotide-binding domain-containing protein [Endomicrobia bacterium]|nr:cyclic nucleotide-binding domain-containing protein [Endomicrobiia bacterium]
MSKIKKLLNYIFIDDVLKADIEFLKGVSIFSHLPDRSLSKIALIIFKKNYMAGEQIYKQRHEADVLYIVRSGEVLVKSSKIEQNIGEGGFFGEISLIENRRHDSAASAVKDSELYLIYRVKFDDMAESNAKAGLRIMKNLSAILEARLRCAEHEMPQSVRAETEQKQESNDRKVR